MQPILSNNYFVQFKDQSYIELNRYLSENLPSTIFILVDENTNKYCLPILLQEIETTNNIEIRLDKITGINGLDPESYC